MELQEYTFTLEHIPGALNHWADLLSRWGVKRPDTVSINVMEIHEDDESDPSRNDFQDDMDDELYSLLQKLIQVRLSQLWSLLQDIEYQDRDY